MSSEASDMLVSAPTLGYSADVQMELLFKGRKYSIGQMGRGKMILEEPYDAGTGEGEVILTIDGVPRRWLVTIGEQPFPSSTITAEFRDAE